MSEIIPTTDTTSVESYIGFLRQADMTEGAVSDEMDKYNNILERWRKHEISDEVAKEEAAGIARGRGVNVH
jgi:hypothetical protein